MPILTGYEYDIFVSYRHNDNKYDGWVSEFVEKLKQELHVKDEDIQNLDQYVVRQETHK